MLVLLAGIFVIHIATVVMLFVSTIANAWLVRNNGTATSGLWQYCIGNSCPPGSFQDDELPALKAVQAFMILAIIFSFISLVMFVVQLFTMEKGKRFYIPGVILLICWLFILIAASIYTAQSPKYFRDPETYHHGYSFILAWICFCFSFIIGVLYLVLRKK